jgi:hypothetical protein
MTPPAGGADVHSRNQHGSKRQAAVFNSVPAGVKYVALVVVH